MIAFLYGDFIYFFVSSVSILAGYGLSFFYIGRQLLSEAQLSGEPLSGQALRQMRTGMSMFLTGLILLALFSIVGIISHKLAIVGAVLIGSVLTTLLAAVLFTPVLKGK